VRAPAIRRVTTESRTGSTNSQRVHTTLTISVRKIDFDAQGGQLHINGQVTEENKIVSVGMFHTLDLELHRNFTLIKSEWDSVTLGVVKEACNPGDRAEIGAVVLQEGLFVCRGQKEGRGERVHGWLILGEQALRIFALLQNI